MLRLGVEGFGEKRHFEVTTMVQALKIVYSRISNN